MRTARVGARPALAAWREGPRVDPKLPAIAGPLGRTFDGTAGASVGDLSIEASRRIFALVALAGAGAAAGWLGAGRALAPGTAEASGRAVHVPSAEIAVIATPRDPFATASEVRLVTIDDTGTRDVRVATFAHAPGAVTRGDVLRGTRAVVIAADVEDAGRDPDWRSALYRVAGLLGLR